jgi:16S rRNA (guanine966-N2)-methyltransferase
LPLTWKAGQRAALTAANLYYVRLVVGSSRQRRCFYTLGMSRQGMSKHQRGQRAGSQRGEAGEGVAGLRIIGGSMRGRKLAYTGDVRTRPMKDRVREAIFNLLGVGVEETHAIDLFAGTGALGLEAISRGAARGTFIERHYPTARVIEQNIAALEIGEQAQVVFGDAFLWSAAFQAAGSVPLTVFCSPPYDFYVERREEMLKLIERWVKVGPSGSLVVVETDERFDFAELARLGEWDVREYPPAVVGIHEC